MTLLGIVEGACETDLYTDAWVRARRFYGPKVAPCLTVQITAVWDIGETFRAFYEARVVHDWPRDGDDAPCRECGTR